MMRGESFGLVAVVAGIAFCAYALGLKQGWRDCPDHTEQVRAMVPAKQELAAAKQRRDTRTINPPAPYVPEPGSWE